MRRVASKVFDPAVPFNPARLPLFYGWVVLLVGTFGIVLSTPGQTIGVGPFNESLLRVMGLDRVELSNAYLFGTLASGLLLPWSGRLFDRYGARLMGTCCMLAFGLHLILMGYVDSLRDWVDPGHETVWSAWLLMLGGFFLLRFLGQGMLTLVCRSMITKWFNRHRGKASALSGMALTLCFTASPLLLLSWVNAYGWDHVWIVMGLGYGSIGAFIVWLTFRDNPEASGLEMDGKKPGEVDTGTKRMPRAIAHEFTASEAIRTPAFWIFTLGIAAIALNITAWTFHALSLSTALGMDANGLYELLPFAAVVNIGIGFLAGWLCDRFTLKLVASLMLLGQILSILGLLALPGDLGSGLFILAHGLTMGCWGPLLNVLTPNYYGRVHMGAINGRIMAATVYASALGPSLYGYSESLTGDYIAALWVSFGIACVLLILVPFARHPQARYWEGF